MPGVVPGVGAVHQLRQPVPVLRDRVERRRQPGGVVPLQQGGEPPARLSEHLLEHPGVVRPARPDEALGHLGDRGPEPPVVVPAVGGLLGELRQAAAGPRQLAPHPAGAGDEIEPRLPPRRLAAVLPADREQLLQHRQRVGPGLPVFFGHPDGHLRVVGDPQS